ncbi:type I-E CRISPR-associated protein Cas6/Cse3/CasE [Actinomyces radicidentis]|uniref:type I-E CRISPR-associated protein Cas6/Cse3/CasE n=1 Tax=Actinomyces radicidentis TaxID=111015 RepID=UPI0028E26FB0|nr:type I-E CRISPR-associated protein Cas6/Cse3/CasE [Actinomyces radicidentis]
MILAKVVLDPTRRQARKMLGSPQVMHAMVAKACGSPETASAGPGRVLWRVDPAAQCTALYVLSPTEPDLSQIVQEAGVTGAETQVANYAPFLSRLEDGQEWAFRLTANPVRSVSQGEGSRGKRFGHVTAAQQGQWLLDRAHGHGFALARLDPDLSAAQLVVRRGHPVFGRSTADGSRRDRVTISHVTFEGVLRVDDANLLREVLVRGLGPSKAYGCGLLTLARPRG